MLFLKYPRYFLNFQCSRFDFDLLGNNISPGLHHLVSKQGVHTSGYVGWRRKLDGKLM